MGGPPVDSEAGSDRTSRGGLLLARRRQPPSDSGMTSCKRCSSVIGRVEVLQENGIARLVDCVAGQHEGFPGDQTQKRNMTWKQ